MFKRAISWLISVVLIFLSSTAYADGYQYRTIAMGPNGQEHSFSPRTPSYSTRSRSTSSSGSRNGASGSEGALGRAGSYPRPAATSSPAASTRAPSLHRTDQPFTSGSNRLVIPTRDTASAEYALALSRVTQARDAERLRRIEAEQKAEVQAKAAAAAREAKAESERNQAKITKVDTDYNGGTYLLREVEFKKGQTDVDGGTWDSFKVYRYDAAALCIYRWFAGNNFWAMEGNSSDGFDKRWSDVDGKLYKWMGGGKVADDQPVYSFTLRFEKGTGNIGDPIHSARTVTVKMKYCELMAMLMHQDRTFD